MKLRKPEQKILKQKLGLEWTEILKLAPEVIKAMILVFQRVRFTDQEAEIIFKKRVRIGAAESKEQILEILKEK